MCAASERLVPTRRSPPANTHGETTPEHFHLDPQGEDLRQNRTVPQPDRWYTAESNRVRPDTGSTYFNLPTYVQPRVEGKRFPDLSDPHECESET